MMDAEPVNLFSIKQPTRVVIIGNGFDLAHGYKLSFGAFVNHLINKAIDSFVNGENQDHNPFLKVTSSVNYGHPERHESLRADGFARLKGIVESHSKAIVRGGEIYKEIRRRTNVSQWIDLETLYFDLLVRKLNITVEERKLAAITELNLEMDFLRDELREYIRQQMPLVRANLDTGIHEQLTSYIRTDIDVNHDLLDINSQPERYLFLNFNYTDLAKRYFNQLPYHIQDSSSYLSIHGTLAGRNDENGQEMIFGYGDEKEKRFLEFEDQKAPEEAYRLIKSFKYLQSRTYQEAIRFLEVEKYQVVIMGHSCGESDRTLLRTIFNHENCVSIRSYYYEMPDNNGDDFFSKSLAISLCFEDKEKFRQRVLNKEDCEPLEQPSGFAESNL